MRSTEKGTELFEHLRSFSFDTTFGVDTLAGATQQLLGVGIAVEDLDSTLMMIGNVAQGDTQKFNELVSVFSKIQNQGKASSLQLQQLALRGVPIYQMLKQMGVEGRATGEEITEAFRRMTSEGGQFENAMERINNTIQGREGFVSDTWREFLTSFAEASGIADVYAKILDVVYAGLQKTVDWLEKINQNPVYQAIFRGVFVSVIGAISSALLLKLIPVIATLIKSIVTLTGVMTAFNATNPFGWIALAISGIAGLTVAYKGLKKEAKELSDIDKENKQRYEIEELMKQYSKDKSKMSNEDVLRLANWQIKYWEEQYKSPDSDEQDRVIAGEEWSKWQREATNRIIKINSQKKPDWYTPPATTQTTEEEYKAENDLLAERIKLFKKFNDEKQKIENEYALLGLEGEALLKMKYIQQGFSEEQSEILAKEQHKLNLLKEEDEKQKDLAEQVKREAEERKKAREQLEANAKLSLSGLQELYKDDGNVAGYYGVQALQQTKVGSAINGAMEGASFGGVWGAVIGAIMGFVSKLEKWQEVLDKFDSGLEPIADVLNEILGNIETILDGAKTLVEVIRPIWDLLSNSFHILTSIGKIINLLFSLFNKLDNKGSFLKTIGKVAEIIGNISDWLEDLFHLGEKEKEEKEKEIERLKALNDQYENLRENLRKEQAFYMKLLQASSSEDYYNTKVTKTNDMILSPKGVFSTHPDDYIMAMKNPSALAGGTNLKVIVNNTVSDSVAVATRVEKIGNEEKLVLQISKKVAYDYMTGANGWDSAIRGRDTRINGREISR